MSARTASESRRHAPLRRRLASLCLIAGFVLAGSPALADEYDDERSGHPLRILAYVVHPVGVLIDYLIMRPAHWLAHHEPVRTLVGHEDQ